MRLAASRPALASLLLSVPAAAFRNGGASRTAPSFASPSRRSALRGLIAAVAAPPPSPSPSPAPRPRSHALAPRNTPRMSSSSSSSSSDPAPVERVPGRAALLQFRVGPSKSTNRAAASSYLARAAASGAHLCVLPEIWNGPYATSAFGEYAEVLPDVGTTLEDARKRRGGDGGGGGLGLGESALLLMEGAARHGMWIVGGSVPERVVEEEGGKERIYNTCLCVDPRGTVVAKHRKVHLFDIDVPGGITFRESDTLTAGDTMTVFDAGEPFGMIGVGICYDIRFPEYALLLCRRHKCNVLIYPGAFNLTTGPAHWELLQRARAVDNQVYVLTASPARSPDPGEGGKYPHYSAWGHSTAVSPWGEVVATIDEGEGVVLADLDMSKVEEMRRGIPTLEQKRYDMYRVTEGGGKGAKEV